jgi:hypothetical protein
VGVDVAKVIGPDAEWREPGLGKTLGLEDKGCRLPGVDAEGVVATVIGPDAGLRGRELWTGFGRGSSGSLLAGFGKSALICGTGNASVGVNTFRKDVVLLVPAVYFIVALDDIVCAELIGVSRSFGIVTVGLVGVGVSIPRCDLGCGLELRTFATPGSTSSFSFMEDPTSGFSSGSPKLRQKLS